jgi:hypothetical protein
MLALKQQIRETLKLGPRANYLIDRTGKLIRNIDSLGSERVFLISTALL